MTTLTRLILLSVTALIAVQLTACNSAPGDIAEISPDELLSSPPGGVVILDVRSAEEFASGHVPDAVHIPHTELAERLAELGAPVDAPVVVYCERGGRAGQAADVLVEAGYRNVLHLTGDMSGWREAGRPTAQLAAGPDQAAGNAP